MDEGTISGLRTILELGWPAIVLVMVVFLWRDYKALLERYIADLREINGLKNPLIVTPDEDTPKAAASLLKRRASRPMR